MESEATEKEEQPLKERARASRWIPVLMVVVSLLAAFALGEAFLRLVPYEVPFLNALRSFHTSDPADYCDYPGRGDDDRALAETYRSVANEYVATMDIEYFDLMPYYEKALADSPGQRLTLIQDCHWTADLHRFMAEALSAYLDGPCFLNAFAAPR